ncbi:MAG: hypothetical protein D6725_01300 [Planctomycetota bacterium]|nr:MAG: hypothetical protein D6725_01300 [Planctomycetota bacterium]
MVAPPQHAENQLLRPLLEAAAHQAARPEVLLGDRTYADAMRDRLRAEGLFVLAPHRMRRRRHDGRHLRRYRRRYLVKRTHSWLQAFRRLVIRYESYSFIDHGFVSLACLILVARTF